MKVNKNWFFSQAATLAKTNMFSFKPTKSQPGMFLCLKRHTSQTDMCSRKSYGYLTN